MFSINGFYADIKDLFEVKNDKEIYVFYMNGIINTYFGTEEKLMATVNRVSRSGFCDWSYDKMLFSEFMEEIIEQNTTQNGVYVDHDTLLFDRLLDLFESDFDRSVTIILKDFSKDCSYSSKDYDGRVLIEENEADIVVDLTNTLKVCALKKQYC